MYTVFTNCDVSDLYESIRYNELHLKWIGKLYLGSISVQTSVATKLLIALREGNVICLMGTFLFFYEVSIFGGDWRLSMKK